MVKISVILPFYNRATTLARCVESVRRQTFEDWEMVAVDDGSTDSGAELLAQSADKRIRLLRHETNRGAGAARDTAMQQARGEYFAFIDSDDEWFPGKLAAQLEALQRSGTRAAKLSSTAFEMIRGHRSMIWPKPFSQHSLDKALHRECTFGFGTTLIIDRHAALSLGGFDRTLPRHEDWDWVLRAFQAGHQLAFVAEPLARVFAMDAVRLDQFIPSTHRFLAKHDAALRRFGANYRRQVVAHHFESVASMCYEQRRYSTGHRYLLWSFAKWPWRNPLPLAALPVGTIDWLLGTRLIQRGAEVRRAWFPETGPRISG